MLDFSTISLAYIDLHVHVDLFIRGKHPLRKCPGDVRRKYPDTGFGSIPVYLFVNGSGGNSKISSLIEFKCRVVLICLQRLNRFGEKWP